MGFKVGQKVVCIDGDNWLVSSGPNKGRKDFGPRTNEILEVSEVYRAHYLCFVEYGNKESFNAEYFRPLDYDFVEEVIKQVTPKEQEA